MESLSFIFNFCSTVKPHPSFFLKIMFNFLSLQHYTSYVMRVGQGKSLPRWLISLQAFGRGVVKCVFTYIRSLDYFLLLQMGQFKNGIFVFLPPNFFWHSQIASAFSFVGCPDFFSFTVIKGLSSLLGTGRFAIHMSWGTAQRIMGFKTRQNWVESRPPQGRCAALGKSQENEDRAI